MNTQLHLFQALADPARLKILARDEEGECAVGDIVARMNIEQSGVSAAFANPGGGRDRADAPRRPEAALFAAQRSVRPDGRVGERLSPALGGAAGPVRRGLGTKQKLPPNPIFGRIPNDVCVNAGKSPVFHHTHLSRLDRGGMALGRPKPESNPGGDRKDTMSPSRPWICARAATCVYLDDRRRARAGGVHEAGAGMPLSTPCKVTYTDVAPPTRLAYKTLGRFRAWAWHPMTSPRLLQLKAMARRRKARHHLRRHARRCLDRARPAPATRARCASWTACCAQPQGKEDRRCS